MGRLWGQSAPVTTHANTIYADISLQPGGAAPIDADADVREVYLAGGDAALDHMALRPLTLYVLRTGIRAPLRSVDRARVMLVGGVSFSNPRHAWWNFVSSSNDRTMVARSAWKPGRFPINS